MIKKVFAFILLFTITIGFAYSQKNVFMYSYFTGNGEDGLHLAYSTDGLKWETLNNNQSFFAPQLVKIN